jgi:genome maintenance exonuclease 1
MMDDKDLEEYHNIGRKIKKNSKYNYVDGRQITDQGSRVYDVAGYVLPSVTTILSRTKDQEFLKNWKAKVGEKEAERIKNLSSVIDPGLYAGQTDLVCVHNGKDTIVDFKQSNRPKREEWIDDYKLQIAAYAMAHDYVHGSSIEQGVIMVCTPDLYYQEFCVSGADLRSWKHKFLKRLDMYHDLKFDEKEQANVNIRKEDFKNE